jgi:threonine dehydrogenase-like Zn-dependent dehydrogenase
MVLKYPSAAQNSNLEGALPSTMRALQISQPQKATIIQSAIPIPAAGEVLIRIEGCGVCGSNLPVWQGREWFTYPLPPGNPGHEAWGHVAALSPDKSSAAKLDTEKLDTANATGLQIGDRVTMLSYNAFAEYDIAKANAVVKLPASLEDKPFPAEPLACALNVFARSGIVAGQTVAIVGIGFLGALLTALAANAGATVIAITRRPFALEMARHFGAAHLIRMDDHWRIIEQVKQITRKQGGHNGGEHDGGEQGDDTGGCDCVIEAVGAQWPLDLAAELTRVRGRLLIAGYHQDGPRQVNMQLWNWRGLDVINAHERDPQVYVAGMRAAVEAVASGRLDPTPLYTHHFALDEAGEALNSLQQRPDGFLKALIQV